MIDEIISQNNSCCLPLMEGENKLIHDYWCQVNACVMEASAKGYAKELFGYDSECAFNAMNNFFYLLDLLMYINREIIRTGNTIDYYKDLYDIDCIKKTFFCHGCNITNALSVFGMEGNYVAPICDDVDQIPTLLFNDPGRVCSETEYDYTIVSNIPGTIITWSRAAVTGINNVAATGSGDIIETLINTTTLPINVTYVITLNYLGSITTANHVVTVYPLAVLTSALTGEHAGCYCVKPTPDTNHFTYTPTSNIAGTTFAWSRTGMFDCDGGLPVSGTGSISDHLWCDAEVESYDVTYTYVLTTPDGCESTYEVVVKVICQRCSDQPN